MTMLVLKEDGSRGCWMLHDKGSPSRCFWSGYRVSMSPLLCGKEELWF